jgi:hypothetical protein
MPKRRSLWAGLSAGCGCGVSGAVAGSLLAGPVGAVAAAAAGLVGGTALGDRVATARRRMMADEHDYVREIFQDSLDLDRVRITRDSLVSAGAPKAVRNTVHLKSDWDHFAGDTLDLSEGGRCVLVHELVHVWQYQNGGLAYIPKSLWAQFVGWRRTGGRSGAYNWRAADEAGLPWELWNPEQQAAAVEQYNRCLRRIQSGRERPTDFGDVKRLERYIDFIRTRHGAPRFWRRHSSPVTP